MSAEVVEKAKEAVKRTALYPREDRENEQLNDIARLAAGAASAALGVVCLKEKGDTWLCGSFGIGLSEIPPHFLHNLYTYHSTDIFEIEHTLGDIRFSNNVLVTGPSAIRYYAGLSVFNSKRQEVGAICLMATTNLSLSTNQRKMLQSLAAYAGVIWDATDANHELLSLKRLLDGYTCMATLNANFEYTFASQHYLELCKLTSQQIKGKLLYQVPATEMIKAERNRIMAAMLKNEVYHFFSPMLFAGKQLNITFIPYADGDGRLCKVHLLMPEMDVMHQAAQEKTLLEVLTGAASWRLNLQTWTQEWSAGMYALLDIPAANMVQPPERIFELVIAEDKEKLRQLATTDWLFGLLLRGPSPRITRKLKGEQELKMPTVEECRNNPPREVVLRLRTPGNETKALRTIVTTTTDEHGKLTHINGVCMAVAPQTTATNYWEQERNRLANDTLGYLLLNADMQIIAINPLLAQWFGKTEEYLKGLTIGEAGIFTDEAFTDGFWEKLNAEGEIKSGALAPIIVNTACACALVHAKAYYNEHNCVHTYAMLFMNTIVAPTTTNTATLVATTDRVFRTLVEESPHMFFLADIEGRFTFANARLSQMLEIPVTELIGTPFAVLYEGDWRKKAVAFYQKQLAEQISETAFMFPMANPAGGTLWMEQIGNLIVEHNEIIGYRFSLFDITERLKSQKAMEEAAREATEAKVMQQTFLGKMSHEIRTPMNGVVGMANLLNTTPLSPEQKEFVDGIKESSVNMIRIINDILDMSKIQAGKLVFEETEFVLKNLVNSVIFSLKAVADQKDIQLLSQIDSQIPDTVIADPVRLNQILLNLSDNALKFTDKGSVSITVLYRELKKEKLTLEFIIADTGIGIAQNKIDAIFESFTQAQSDTTRKYGGTGLGLTIAKQLIEQQGGIIKVSSKVGQGTTFTFTFHFKLNPENIATTQARKADVKLADLSGFRILLVEDNLMNQRVAKYTIEKWGAAVTIAESGFVALELLAAQPFDLILMDIQMPEMSGLETTSKIRRELKKTTPIVAMTASVMQGERENCMKAGMNEYISKPFNPMELNHKMHNLITARKQKTGRKITDINYLKGAVGGETGAVREILELYLSKTPPLMEAIEHDLNNGYFGAIKAKVHNLKNSVGVLGANQLFHLIDTIEFSLTGERPSPDIMAMIGQMGTMVRQSVTEVDEEYNAM